MAAQIGWDEDWVQVVLENGRGQSFDQEARRTVMQAIGEAVPRSWWQDAAEQQHLVEIVWHYRKGVHEDYELPVLYLTVYCPGIKDSYGYHGPADIDHYPYYVFTCEDIDNPIAESRGVAEVGKPFQQQLKKQRDNFINRADMNIIPPLLVTATAMLAKSRLPFRPGYQQPLPARAEMKYLPLPPTASDAANVTELTEREGDRYFARIAETEQHRDPLAAPNTFVGVALTKAQRFGGFFVVPSGSDKVTLSARP